MKYLSLFAALLVFPYFTFSQAKDLKHQEGSVVHGKINKRGRGRKEEFTYRMIANDPSQAANFYFSLSENSYSQGLFTSKSKEAQDIYDRTVFHRNLLGLYSPNVELNMYKRNPTNGKQLRIIGSFNYYLPLLGMFNENRINEIDSYQALSDNFDSFSPLSRDYLSFLRESRNDLEFTIGKPFSEKTKIKASRIPVKITVTTTTTTDMSNGQQSTSSSTSSLMTDKDKKVDILVSKSWLWEWGARYAQGMNMITPQMVKQEKKYLGQIVSEAGDEFSEDYSFYMTDFNYDYNQYHQIMPVFGLRYSSRASILYYVTRSELVKGFRNTRETNQAYGMQVAGRMSFYTHLLVDPFPIQSQTQRFEDGKYDLKRTPVGIRFGIESTATRLNTWYSRSSGLEVGLMPGPYDMMSGVYFMFKNSITFQKNHVNKKFFGKDGFQPSEIEAMKKKSVVYTKKRRKGKTETVVMEFGRDASTGGEYIQTYDSRPKHNEKVKRRNARRAAKTRRNDNKFY